MNSNYRETKYDLIPCPFNPIHKVKKCRLITHKKKCPDRNKNGFLECPYNTNHIINIGNIEKHKQICPNQVIINPNLEKEMIAYIKNRKNNNKKYNPLINYKTNDKIESKENLGNNIKIIETKIPKNMNNKNKIKNKKNNHIKEDIINLETMTNKDLFNFFNDNMVIEYHSDSENDDDYINGNIYI